MKSVLAVLLAALPAAAATTHRYIVTVRPVVNRPAARVFGDDAEVARHGARDLALINAFAADLTDDEAAALKKSKDVRSVTPVVERHLLDVPAAPHATSGGPLSRTQAIPYGIELVGAPHVWPLSRGEGVNVVVIDTGVAAQHPDLGANIAGGYNAQSQSDDFADDNGHGTHVAGTIGAEDNSLGVIGVAPEARVWSVKALDVRGSGTDENIVDAARWVLAKKRELGGRWIVSMSFGSSEASAAEADAFRQLRDADVLCVAAAGNSGFLELDYPAAYPSVLSVGAVDATSSAAWFSSGGGTLGVMAPGVDVLSTVPVGSFANSSVQRGTARVGGMPFKESARGDFGGGFVSCGSGNPGQCGDATGKIAVITRGDGLYFAEKVRNAVADGAVGAIIVNYDDGPLFIGSLVRPVCDPGATCTDNPDDLAYHWPPVILVTKSDGDALVKQTGSVALSVWDDDYAMKSGTSMAAPHVAGVAALLWSLAPSAHAIDIRRAIELTARDLGTPGFDPVNGNGLIDAAAAARMLGATSSAPRHHSAGH